MSISLMSIAEAALSALNASRLPGPKVPPKRRIVAKSEPPLAPEPR